jgi:hypothetical protein
MGSVVQPNHRPTLCRRGDVAKLSTMLEPEENPPTPHHSVQQFLEELGPGLITGAADDDPSGISTYSVAGASYGYATLWTALLSFPLMAAIQLMCARLGMVTGCGLASVIRTRYFRWVLWFACALVIVANVFNIGANLGDMADAMQMITHVPAFYWTPFFCCPHHGSSVLNFLSNHSADLQMAHHGFVCVHHHRVPGASQLGRGAPSDLRSAHRMDQRISRGPRGNSRNHDFSLSVLLTGCSGSGGRARPG